MAPALMAGNTVVCKPSEMTRYYSAAAVSAAAVLVAAAVVESVAVVGTAVAAATSTSA